MLQKIKIIFTKGDFVKNVLTLTSGTIIAQAIPILISPILTRIYTPEDFGAIAVFISLATLFAVIANGKYELAVMLPKKDEDAINIFVLGLIISTTISFILLIVILLFHDQIMYYVDNEKLNFWLYLLPLVVFMMGLYSMLNYFNNRKKRYKDIAISKVVKAIVLSAVQLSIGFLKKGATGLFSGQISSVFFANTTLLKNILKDKVLLSKINKQKIIELAKKYKKFPKYSAPSSFLNEASLQIPILLLGFFFLPNVVGFFSLSHRFISMPMSIIGNSIGQVYFQKSAEIKNDKLALKNLTFNTYKKLLQLGIIPFSIFTFFGDYIFSFFFGSKWIIAGEYVQLLSIWILFVFIISPISNLFATLELQKKALNFNIAIFISRISILMIGGLLIKDAYTTILIYGITGTIFWIFWGFYLLKTVGVKLKESFTFTIKYLVISLSFFGVLRFLIG